MVSWFKNIAIYILLQVLLVFSFILGANAGEVRTYKATNPIFIAEIIEMPTDGVLHRLKGDIRLKKKGVNKYEAINSGNVVDGDILEFNQGASAEIRFRKHDPIIINSVEQDKWFFLRVR